MAAKQSLIVDLIIPARNEQQSLPRLLEKLPRHLFRHIIVADNGSTDQTASVAAQFNTIVVPEPRPGYGYACLAAIDAINRNPHPPDAVAFIDADLSDDPNSLETLIRTLADRNADIVIASRVKLAQPGSLTLTQRFGNALACTLIRLLAGKSYTDLGPMRIVRYDALKVLNMQDRTWGWTVEMQYKAAALNLNTVEIDTPYHPRIAGTSKISGSIIGSIKAGSKILATIARLYITTRRDRRQSIPPQESDQGPA